MKRLQMIVTLAVLVSMVLSSSLALASGPATTKSAAHTQGAGATAVSGKHLSAIPFNNPNYTYTKIVDGGSTAQYKQVGIRPQGDKILAQKQFIPSPNKIEIVVMNLDGTGETMISAGDSNSGDIFGYMNPFWSDDGTKVGFVEVHNANPNKVVVYDMGTATQSYLYEPVARADVANPDFVGSSTSKIVFWAYGPVGGADLFVYDASTATLTNITNTSDYKEYEPVSNLAGDVILYWSGETTAEPVNTTHILKWNGSAWVKDSGFTPVADTYWSYFTGRNGEKIVTTVMSSKDVLVYTNNGTFDFDLTGPGYSGGSGQWNFVGSHPQGPSGEIVVSSNADNPVGRDIWLAVPDSATWYAADTYGNDSNACTSWARPCETIGAAVGKALPGGTVRVAAGTYNESQIIIDKALSLLGAGIGQSIINGGGGSGAATTGLIRVTSGSGNVTVSGFTLQNAKGDGNATPVRIFVLATGGGNQTYKYLKIIGSGLDDSEEYGFYSSYNAANVTLMHSDVSSTGANAVIFERHTGTSEVAFNTIAVGAFGSDTYYNMSYGGVNITALQNVHDNSIDLGACTACVSHSGITFASSFTPPGGIGGYSDVEITNNVIYNLKTNSRGIALWNGATGDGTAGNIANAKITGNKISGTGYPANTNSKGIQLLGLISSAVIQGNSISDVDYAFHGRLNTAGSPVYPAGTVMNNNAFASSTKFQWDDPANTLVAEYNWWGDVDGPCPPATQPGCTGLGVPVSANVDYSPFDSALVAGVTASTHEIGETGTLDTKPTVNGLYGAQLRVNHDPTILTWSSGARHDVSAQGWFWDYVTDNFSAMSSPAGRRVAGSMQNNLHPNPANLLGTASIATWNYTCSGVGASSLIYQSGSAGTVLSDKNFTEIPAALIGDSITCLAATGSVNGTIELQGRAPGATTPRGWNDAIVTFACASGGCLGYGPYVFVTDVSGAYQMVKSGAGTGMVAGTYNVTATRHEYLTATKTGVVVTAVGPNAPSQPKLLGGDANNSGKVEITDLTCMGGAFGQAPVTCGGTGSSDINQDGITNILDLVAAGGNYDLTSSPWTP